MFEPIDENRIRRNVQKQVNKHETTKTNLGKSLMSGQSRTRNIYIRTADRFLNGKKDIAIREINNVARKYDKPARSFLDD